MTTQKQGKKARGNIAPPPPPPNRVEGGWMSPGVTAASLLLAMLIMGAISLVVMLALAVKHGGAR